MLVMTSFYSVQDTEIFKKKKKKTTKLKLPALCKIFLLCASLLQWAGPGHEESHQSVVFFW